MANRKAKNPTPTAPEPAGTGREAEDSGGVVPASEHAGEAPEATPETEHGEDTGMQGLVDDLGARREKAKLGGGEEKIAVQHERGTLTWRPRRPSAPRSATSSTT